MGLLAEKIRIKSDLSNINCLFRKLFLVEYSSLRDDDEENTSTREAKIFIKLKKGNDVCHLPIDGFDGDINDGEYCMSFECDYSKKIDVEEDQKELKELNHEINKKLREKLGEPSLQ